MKNLVIDARMIGKVGHGIALYVEGIARSFREGEKTALGETLFELLGVPQTNIKITFLISSNCPQESVVRSFNTVHVDTPVFGIEEWISIPRVLDQLDADLFFNPSFTSFPNIKIPYVQTVHDLNHLRFGSIAHKLYYQTLLKHSIRKAKKVFTVSEVMKKELIQWTQLPESHFMVTYNRIDSPHKVSSEETKKILEKFDVKSRCFFLGIDAIKAHKNISILRNPSEPWKNAFEKISQGENFPLKLVSGISNDELSVLYHECAAFFFPSLYEGFGRPPIEAALAGARVFASDIPVHREAKEWLAKSNPEAAARIELLKI